MFESAISKVSRKLLDPETGQEFVVGMDAGGNTYVIDAASSQNGTHFVRKSENAAEDDATSTSSVLKRVALGTGGAAAAGAIMVSRDTLASKNASQIGDAIYHAPQIDGFQVSKDGADQIGKVIEDRMRSPMAWHVFQFLSLFTFVFGLRRALFGDEPFVDTVLKAGLVTGVLYAAYLIARTFFGA